MHTIVIKGEEPDTTVVIVTDSKEAVGYFRSLFGDSVLLDYEYSDGRIETN